MSNENEKKPLTLAPRGKLELKKTEEVGQVRQNFSHGRSKVVTVERRKKRIITPAEAAAAQTAAPEEAVAEVERETVTAPSAEAAPAPAVAAPVAEAPAPAAAPTPAPVDAPSSADAPAPVDALDRPAAPAPVEAVASRPAPTPVQAPTPAPAPVAARPAPAASAPAASTGGKSRGPAQKGGGGRGGSGRAAASASSGLTNDERSQRLLALQAAMRADEEAKRQAEIDAVRQAEEEKRRKSEEAEAEQRRALEEAEAKARAAEAPPVVESTPEPAAEAQQPQTQAAEAPAAQDEAAEGSAAPRSDRPAADTSGRAPVSRRLEAEDDEDGKPRRGGAAGVAAKAAPKPAPKRTTDDSRRRGKLTISTVLSGDEGAQRGRSMAAMRRAAQKEKRKLQALQPAEKVVREVIVPDVITVQEFANRMAERAPNVIKALMKMGVMATINQPIDADTAELVAQEFGHTIKRVSEADVEVGLESGPDAEGNLISRAPVVTVMGHVDHGKTSLLDALRSTDVVSGEAGGITQHIGAYQVTMKSGAKITFIDTPGHEAFTAMRSRGAKVTDIVVLVVAADDGIMPQTVEAIRHAKAAEAPIVVAINKIDKPGADPNRVRTDLLQHEIVVEEMGGDVLTVEVSAKQRLNLEKLEEAILLQAEILDLKSNPNRSGEGVVVEAKMEKGRGSVATVLVKRGTLKVGDVFIAGKEWGRIRAMMDDHGNRVEEATPAMPVEILGLQGTPSAGDDFIVVEDEARARDVTAYRQRKEREAQAVRSARGTMEQMFAKIQAGEIKELPVVVKSDVQGSAEALTGTLEKIGSETAKVRVLHAAVGAINESDVTLAKASEALIIGFNVRANPQARELARRDGIDIRYYSIIYDVAEDMKRALTGMLDPTFKEKFIGYAEIRTVFNITKVGKVAGCMVTEGTIKRGCKVRLLRDNVVIHEGDLSQLKRFKDDVREVREGFECGMSLVNYNDIQVGDVIECFEMEQVATQL